MGIQLIDVYRSPNVGVFMRANDSVLLAPKGMAPSKTEKICKTLEVRVSYVSVGESRLIGPLLAMNNNGALVSRLAEEGEIAEITEATGMNVARLDSRFTSAGNLIAANDKFAVVSPLLDSRSIAQVRDVLGTEVERLPMGEYALVGALTVATNKGAAVYPGLDDSETRHLSTMFGAEAVPTSVNRGVPFVASGLVANTKGAVVGTQTTGPELVFITRALSV